jgi:thiosulfate reductase / polysulfide reductase chain A
MALTRRQFLKAAGLTAGAGLFAEPIFSQLSAMQPSAAPALSRVPTYCEICFWKCGAFARVVDGKVAKLEGNLVHPNSRGKLCARGNAGMGLLYDPDRLKSPLVSTGARGEGKFKKASWDEALNVVAEKMERIKRAHGAEALALFVHGSTGSHFQHLMSAYGCPNVAMPSFAQCRGPRDVGYELTFGMAPGSPERVDMVNSKVVVLFATHLGENMHNSQVQDFTEAVARGAKIIVVDPRFSTAAGKAEHWLPIRPGADMALALAWTNIIIQNNWHDKAYLDRYATGFRELAASVKHCTPEWAEKETDIPAATVLETARLIGTNRPAVCIHPGRHATWHGNDVQRARSLAILTAVLGAYGREGGIFFPTTASFPKAAGAKPYPDMREPVSQLSGYPFAGAEGLTNAVRTAVITGKPYPVKGWIVAGTNLMKTLPNQQETLEAIKKLDLLVSVDVMPFDTVMLSDVILPECSYLERYDDLAVGKGKSLGVAIRMPAVQPLYESRDGYSIARDLAVRLKLGDYFPAATLEEKIKKQCQAWGISYDELVKKGFISVPQTANPFITPQNPPVFATASGKIELVSSELKHKGFDAVPRYAAQPQPPAGMLRLLYGRSPVHTFSRTVNNPWLHELQRENEVWVSRKKAKELGIAHGQYVVLTNQDGAKSNRVRAKVTERIREDCVYIVHGFGNGSPQLRKAYLKGADDQGLITRYAVDPICGSTGMRTNFVKIEREA